MPPKKNQDNMADLEQWLWAAANILRGPIDQGDFKSYIFPLLFLKRLSDVYDEEFAEALELSGNDEEFARLADQHRFQIPAGSHWNDIRSVNTNVGNAIDKAMKSIERANPQNLFQIFGDVQWTNKARLPDSLLRDLVEHFSSRNLSPSKVPNDLLGDAYEYLIKRFADKSRKSAGEFFTPRTVVELMINILDPKPGETIYDPSCGSGGMLIESVKHVKEEGGDPRLLFGRIYGQEKNLNTAAMARMNLILHGMEDFSIATADTLREPQFVQRDTLMTFDCVIANPPFSLKSWGGDQWEHDPWGRNIAGTPPTSSGDWAWLQHMISSMAAGHGRMAVVLPLGALFRGQSEGRIRNKVLDMDIIEAVIELGPNLFYGTAIPACIVVARASKPKNRRGRILFVNASDLFRTGRNQNTLEAEHVERIFSLYAGNENVDLFSRVVDTEDVKSGGGDLSPGKFVTKHVAEDLPSIDEAMSALRAAASAVRESEARVLELLKDRGLL
ncbi:MAG: N-6 DNA methylase [Actinomycetota bacterium]